jgi:hypothetical protein
MPVDSCHQAQCHPAPANASLSLAASVCCPWGHPGVLLTECLGVKLSSCQDQRTAVALCYMCAGVCREDVSSCTAGNHRPGPNTCNCLLKVCTDKPPRACAACVIAVQEKVWAQL